jgi:hypothetical protein
MTKHKTLKCNLFIHLLSLHFPPPQNEKKNRVSINRKANAYTPHLLVILMRSPLMTYIHMPKNIKERENDEKIPIWFSMISPFIG